MLHAPRPHAFAIVGIGCRFPGGANSPQQFWKLLCDGVDAVTEIPPDRFDVDAYFDADPGKPGKMSVRWGGYVDGIQNFDAQFFRVSPREATRIDPQHRLLLESVWEALEDGGQDPDAIGDTPTGVFVGLSSHDYGNILTDPRHRESIDAHVGVGNAMRTDRSSGRWRGCSRRFGARCRSSRRSA
jgi:acyl transferase domain-containing protein